MLAWNSITPPSKSTYYRNLHRVENAICRMAEESCKHYWDAMDYNTIIAFDGSWSQRRNAFHCITDFIDILVIRCWPNALHYFPQVPKEPGTS